MKRTKEHPRCPKRVSVLTYDEVKDSWVLDEVEVEKLYPDEYFVGLSGDELDEARCLLTVGDCGHRPTRKELSRIVPAIWKDIGFNTGGTIVGNRLAVYKPGVIDDHFYMWRVGTGAVVSDPDLQERAFDLLRKAKEHDNG